MIQDIKTEIENKRKEKYYNFSDLSTSRSSVFNLQNFVDLYSFVVYDSHQFSCFFIYYTIGFKEDYSTLNNLFIIVFPEIKLNLLKNFGGNSHRSNSTKCRQIALAMLFL